MTAAVRVLLAEPDRPTRMGLRLALGDCGLDIAAEVGDSAAAVEAARRERPHLALVASDLPGGGIDAVRAIAAEVPATRIVVLTARQSGDELVAAVLAGASGYLGKDTGRSRLPQALAGVLAGEAAVPRRYTQHILEALRRRDARRALLPGRARDRLTDRQWEVLNLLADGRSTAEIAHRLGIAQVTARRHISSVLPKLGMRDRAGAVELMRGRSRE
jgi:two-component system, NarL family, nitrate/nitrite response regulator NarL